MFREEASVLSSPHPSRRDNTKAFVAVPLTAALARSHARWITISPFRSACRISLDLRPRLVA